MRRSKNQVMADLLRTLSVKPMKKTPLMYKANLSHKSLATYLKELEEAGMIRYVEKGKVIYVEITETGRHMLHEIDRFQKLSDAFGI